MERAAAAPKIKRRHSSPRVDRQLTGSPAFPLLIRYQLMKIDENTPGSIASQETVRVLKGWLLALYFADCLVCTFVALGKGHSVSYGFWLLFKSLFFSYGVGIVLLVIVNKFLLRVIGITKPTPVGFLRYCVLLAGISVIMGGVLTYGISPVGHDAYRARKLIGATDSKPSTSSPVQRSAAGRYRPRAFDRKFT